MKRISGGALESRANSLLMDAEMLLITHIHQPIVVPPAIRVDDAMRGLHLAPNRGL